MMRLWERNDVPPPVESAPVRRERKHPYMVLCHRRYEEQGEQMPAAGAGFDEPSPSETDSRSTRTAVVYQWVRI
jgi:hypothetical protein